jgi:hypothetical protein
LKSKFFIKLLNWEYWPTKLVYTPLIIYAVGLGIRIRNFTYFSLVNPDIEAGGLFGASKYKQLQKLHPDLIPKTLFVEAGSSFETCVKVLNKNQMYYPFIAKPDRGERGTAVELIKSETEFRKYCLQSNFDIVIQEYIDYKFEAGVFYYRMPNETKGHIPSLVIKDFLKIIGDGKHTIEELMMQSDRAVMVLEKVRSRLKEQMKLIPKLNEIHFLEPIGNHNRGTKFVNGNQYISKDLEKIFDKIAFQLVEYHYGRFDLRAPSLEDFLLGKNLKIVEVNGVNAEPAHIYDPSTSLWVGLKTLIRHWGLVFDIAMQNKKRGYEAMPVSEVWKYLSLRKKAYN